MAININHLGFLSILQEEEVIVEVFRKKRSYVMSRLILWGGFFSLSAGAVRFINPDGLLYIWIGIFLLGGLKMCEILLWWNMNALLMTNASLIKVSWKKLFQQTTTRIDYWDIDEIEVVQKGLNALIYHFGDLHITKVSGAESTHFGPIHNPQKIADTIAHFKEQMVHNKQFSEDAGIKDLLSQLISRHVETHGNPELVPKIKRAPAQELPVSNLEKERQKKRFWKSSRSKPSTQKPEEIYEDEPQPHTTIVEKKLDNNGGIEIDL